MASSADIIVDLVARTARFERSMERANKRLGVVARSAKAMRFALRAAGAAFLGFAAGRAAGAAREQLRFAANLQRVAETVGFTTEQVQELRFASEQLNLSQQTIDLGLQRFSRRLGEAAQGGGELLKIVEQYNVRLRESDGTLRNNIDVLGEFANIIASTADEQEQLRIAFKLFDSEGAGLVRLLRQGSGGLADFRQQARELGAVVDASMIDKAAEADRQLNQLDQVMRAKLLVTVADNSEAIGTLAGWFTTLGQKAIEASNPVRDFFSIIKIGGEGLGKFAARIVTGDELDPIVDVTDKLSAARQKLNDLRKIQQNLPQRFRNPETDTDILREIAALEQQITDLTKLRTFLIKEQQQAHERQIQLNIRTAAATRDLAKAQEEVAFSAAGIEEIDLFDIYERARRPMARYRTEMRKAREDKEKLRNSAEELGFTFSSAFEDAIVQAQSLRAVVRGLLQDIVRIFVRRRITEPLGGFLTTLFGGVPKFAAGGSFTVGGGGGTDSQLVAFRATPGERVDVRTPAQQRPSAPAITQNFNFPLAFPPQLEAFVRNVAGSAGRDAAVQVLAASRGRF